MTYERFNDWSKAFDACRERNHPMRVSVWDEPSDAYVDCVIFPSGAIKQNLVQPSEDNA